MPGLSSTLVSRDCRWRRGGGTGIVLAFVLLAVAFVLAFALPRVGLAGVLPLALPFRGVWVKAEEEAVLGSARGGVAVDTAASGAAAASRDTLPVAAAVSLKAPLCACGSGVGMASAAVCGSREGAVANIGVAGAEAAAEADTEAEPEAGTEADTEVDADVEAGREADGGRFPLTLPVSDKWPLAGREPCSRKAVLSIAEVRFRGRTGDESTSLRSSSS